MLLKLKIGGYILTSEKRVLTSGDIIPHVHILRVINDDLFALGCILEIIEFTDDVRHSALYVNVLDTNYFQHLLCLNKFNAEKALTFFFLVIHFDPLRLYSGKETSLDYLNKDVASVAMHNDSTIEIHALHLLTNLNLIEIASGKEELVT